MRVLTTSAFGFRGADTDILRQNMVLVDLKVCIGQSLAAHHRHEQSIMLSDLHTLTAQLSSMNRRFSFLHATFNFAG